MVRKSLLGEVWTTSSSLSHSPHALSILGKCSWGPYLCSVVHCYYPTSLFWIVTTRICCPNCSEHVLEQNGYNTSKMHQIKLRASIFQKIPPPSLSKYMKVPRLLLTQNPVWIPDSGTTIFFNLVWKFSRIDTFLPTHPPPTKNPVWNPVKLQAYDWLQVLQLTN